MLQLQPKYLSCKIVSAVRRSATHRSPSSVNDKLVCEDRKPIGYFLIGYQLLQSLTLRSRAAHADASDVGYNLVLNLWANYITKYSFSLALQSHCPELILLDDVVDSARLDASGYGQSHERLFPSDRIGGNNQNKEKSGQRSCGHHDCKVWLDKPQHGLRCSILYIFLHIRVTYRTPQSELENGVWRKMIKMRCKNVTLSLNLLHFHH